MNVAQFVNQTSYAISAGILLACTGCTIVRRGATPRALVLFAALAVGLALPPLWLRSTQHELRELEVALGGSGRPTLLEVYSDL